MVERDSRLCWYSKMRCVYVGGGVLGSCPRGAAFVTGSTRAAGAAGAGSAAVLDYPLLIRDRVKEECTCFNMCTCVCVWCRGVAQWGTDVGFS